MIPLKDGNRYTNVQWFANNYNQGNYTFQNVPTNAILIVDNPQMLVRNISNIYIQMEPDIIHPYQNYIIQNAQHYAQIYTFNEKVLKACPNAKRFYYATTWLKPEHYQAPDVSRKRFQVSMLAGSKRINNAPGHILRQIIHLSQERIPQNPPVTYFRSSAQNPHIKDFGNNPFLEDDKTVLFNDYQFAIIIENSRQTNYFTEKLMDCLLMKTIPIYYGAPNIGDIFKTDSWPILESGSVAELIACLSRLDAGYYERYAADVEENHRRAQQYTNVFCNIDTAA